MTDDTEAQVEKTTKYELTITASGTVDQGTATNEGD